MLLFSFGLRRQFAFEQFDQVNDARESTGNDVVFTGIVKMVRKLGQLGLPDWTPDQPCASDEWTPFPTANCLRTLYHNLTGIHTQRASNGNHLGNANLYAAMILSID